MRAYYLFFQRKKINIPSLLGRWSHSDVIVILFILHHLSNQLFTSWIFQLFGESSKFSDYIFLYFCAILLRMAPIIFSRITGFKKYTDLKLLVVLFPVPAKWKQFRWGIQKRQKPLIGVNTLFQSDLFSDCWITPLVFLFDILIHIYPHNLVCTCYLQYFCFVLDHTQLC